MISALCRKLFDTLELNFLKRMSFPCLKLKLTEKKIHRHFYYISKMQHINFISKSHLSEIEGMEVNLLTNEK